MRRKIKRDTEIKEFERDLNSDEDWLEISTQRKRRYVKGRILHRIHDGISIFDDIKYPGPTFDVNKMVDSIIDTIDNYDVAGYSYAIVRYGKLLDAAGVGYARTRSEQNSEPMSPYTRMVSASLAKPVCAISIMKLIEEGKIQLDDKAYNFIKDKYPNVHDTVKNITIYQLLTHTSGLNGPAKLSGFDAVLKNAVMPTQNSDYHNANYWFLAFVVEGVTGQGYIDYARRNILIPMTISEMNNKVDTKPCLYYKQGELFDGVSWGDFNTTAIGAYGWYASAIDWAKFLAYFRYNKVLDKNIRYLMLNDDKRFFGFQKWFGEDRGTYYGHGGDFYKNGYKGFRGGIMSFPDEIDAVLLINTYGNFDPETILINAYHAAYS
ncbi:MAG: serine hydrolase [Candidatus Nitrosocaldaceae archaeon]|nr:MAG: serine hydrolase [Candidatus Nitrosocaldaceae archaeon]